MAVDYQHPLLKESDNRFTSPELIRAIEFSFGRIDLDPCWHAASSVRPRRYFDVRNGDDGLRDDWRGRLVFVNPPWSDQKRWVERAHDQWLRGIAKTVVCVVPAKTDTKFFHNDLARDADVFFLEGRPRFFREDGKSEGTMVSVMVVIFGATNDQRRRFAGRVKGSWWLPGRLPSVNAEKTELESLDLSSNYDPFSCAAQDLWSDGLQTVFCTSFSQLSAVEVCSEHAAADAR